MALAMTKKSGYVLRIMSVGAFSCMMIFAALVVLQNLELTKLIPDSPSRSMAIFFGYIVSIFTFNYALAIKGRNFMGWKVEMLTMLGLSLAFAGIYFPYAFPVVETIKVSTSLPFWTKEQAITSPEWRYLWISVISVPFFVYVYMNLRSMPLWMEVDWDK